MMIPGVEHRRLRSFDGTEIAYQVRGEGPAVVLANGLGGSYPAWRHQYEALGERFRTICWDYRGLYRSARPADLATLALSRQVEDLERILRAEGIARAVLVGWSMGVQFNFEYYRRFPSHVAGIVALNGTAGLPFHSVPAGRWVARVLPSALEVAKRGGPLLGGGVRLAAGWGGLIPWLKRLGLVGETLDERVFNDLAAEFATLDFEVYAETFRFLGEHDARDLLPRVEVPSLVVTGTRDLMTPLQTARQMAQQMPDSQLVVIPGGTHYTAVEFPDQVNRALLAFLQAACDPA